MLLLPVVTFTWFLLRKSDSTPPNERIRLFHLHERRINYLRGCRVRVRNPTCTLFLSNLQLQRNILLVENGSRKRREQSDDLEMAGSLIVPFRWTPKEPPATRLSAIDMTQSPHLAGADLSEPVQYFSIQQVQRALRFFRHIATKVELDGALCPASLQGPPHGRSSRYKTNIHPSFFFFYILYEMYLMNTWVL